MNAHSHLACRYASGRCPLYCPALTHRPTIDTPERYPHTFIDYLPPPGISGLQKHTATNDTSHASQRLLGLLCESLLSVYIGLCICALYSRDCCALYRLASSARLGEAKTWFRVFGGGYRVKPVRPPTPVKPVKPPPPSPTAVTRQEVQTPRPKPGGPK